jgi:7,8-dihydroneopterin aldolase/epimerase/oxygenase
MACLRIAGLEFYAWHGVPEEERRLGHRYACDLEMEYDMSDAIAGDDVMGAVNYAEVAERVVTLMRARPSQLIETAAAAIGDMVLREYPPVLTVTVRLRKLLPPVPVTMAHVEVELTFHRQ